MSLTDLWEKSKAEFLVKMKEVQADYQKGGNQ